jgi:hypothetical protein
MKKKNAPLLPVFLLLLVSALTAPFQSRISFAEEPQKVAVLPFSMHSERDLGFLSEGILDMLASRLYRKDTVVVIEKPLVKKAMGDYKGPITLEYATQLGLTLHADHVVFGSLTLFGESVSLDATMASVKKKEPPVAFFVQSKGLESVIPEIDKLSQKIHAKIFGRPFEEPEPPAPPPQPPVSEKAPASSVAPLNPQFKEYHRADAQDTSSMAFWKSRTFNTEIRGMDIGDVDGDGLNEIVLLEGIELKVYDYLEGSLRRLASHASSDRSRFLAVDVADINENGRAEIFASRVSGTSVTSVVLEMEHGRLKPLAENSPWFYRVMNWPGRGRILLGQQKMIGSYGGEIGLIDSYFVDGIKALSWNGSEYAESEDAPLLDLPGLFIYNFAIGDLSGDGSPKIVLIDKSERLRILDNKGEELHRTSDYFGGTLNFVVTNPDEGKSIDRHFLFLPARILIADLDGNGRGEVIINQNTSSTGGITERFKAFSDGKIISLSWTGLSLSPNWESAKLSGCLSDYQVKDLDNDGNPDLVVALIQQRGASFFREARSVVVSYKLTPGEKRE